MIIRNTRCIKWCFFVSNFLWVALVVFYVGAWVYSAVTYKFTYNTPVEILYLVIGIALPLLNIAIAFFGCFGAIKEHRRMVIIYAVALLITFIIEFAFAIKGFVEIVRYYNNEHTARVDSYQSDFDNYWTEDSARVQVDYMQSHDLCCGSTGPSHWNKFTSKKIPWSCCGSDESVTCTESIAFTTGCVPLLHADFYHFFAPSIGIPTGMLAIELVCFVFVLILAKSFSNIHQRETIYSEEMDRLN